MEDNLGSYTGTDENFDCDDTGIVDNTVQITDPDGSVKVVMQPIQIPVGVHSSKEVVYKYSYLFEPADTVNDALTITMSGSTAGSSTDYVTTLVSTSQATVCREDSRDDSTYMYTVDSPRGGALGKTCANLAGGWCDAENKDGTNWGTDAWDGTAWDADLAKSINLWKNADGVFPGTACCECGGGSKYTTKVGALSAHTESVQFEFQVGSVQQATVAGFDSVHVGTRGCMDATAATYDKNAIVSGKCTAGSDEPTVASAANSWVDERQCENPEKGTCFRVTNAATTAQYVRISNEGAARDWKVLQVKLYDQTGAEITGGAPTPTALFNADDADFEVVAPGAAAQYIEINLGAAAQISRVQLRQRTVVQQLDSALQVWGPDDGLEMASVAFSLDATFDSDELSAKTFVDLAHRFSPSTDTMSRAGMNPQVPGLDLPAATVPYTVQFDMSSQAAQCLSPTVAADPCTVDTSANPPTACSPNGGAGDCVLNKGSLDLVRHTFSSKAAAAVVVDTDTSIWHELSPDITSDVKDADCTADGGKPAWWVKYAWFDEYCDTSPCCNDEAATPASYSASCTEDRHDFQKCEYDEEAIRVKLVKDRLVALSAVQSQSRALLTQIRDKMKQRHWARTNLILPAHGHEATGVVCPAGFERTGSKWFQQAPVCSVCTAQDVSPSGRTCTACAAGCTFVSASAPCSCPSAATPTCTGDEIGGADGACHQCPARSSPDASHQSCILQCQPNSEPAADGLSCTPCPTGSVSATGSACTPCASGEYIVQVIKPTGLAVLSCRGCPDSTACPADATGLTSGAAAPIETTGATGSLTGDAPAPPPDTAPTTTCTASSCQNGGACSEDASSASGHTCGCATGWSGTVCDVVDLADECSSNPCSTLDATATCTNGVSSYTCTCNPTYAGENCQDQVCGPGKQPLAGSDPLTCQDCPADQYSPGQSVMCTECAADQAVNADQSDCDVECTCGATVNIVSSSEFSSCQSCENFCRTSCEAWEDNSALAGCSNTFSLCTDTCANAEVWNSGCEACGAIAGGRHVLESPTVCTECPAGTSRSSTTGDASVVCQAIVCAAGTELVGNACEDIDECLATPCNAIDVAAACTNLDNAFTCQCSAGFSGTTCETEYDPCDEANACSQQGACTSTDSTTWTCVCNDGYGGARCDSCAAQFARDGSLCVDDPCLPENPCRANYNDNVIIGGDCAFAPGTGGLATSFTCACLPGFSGSACDEFDPCLAGYCGNEELTPPGTPVYSMTLAVDCATGQNEAWQLGFRAELAQLLGIVTGATVSAERIQVIGVQCGSVLISYVITPGDPPASELADTITVLTALAQEREEAGAAAAAATSVVALQDLNATTISALTVALDAATSVGTTVLASATVERTIVPGAPPPATPPPPTIEDDDFPLWAIIVIAIVATLLLLCSVFLCCPGTACDQIRNCIGIGKPTSAKKEDVEGAK